MPQHQHSLDLNKLVTLNPIQRRVLYDSLDLNVLERAEAEDQVQKLIARRPTAAGRSGMLAKTMNQRDKDRMELLDRVEKRLPELDLDQHSIEWTTLDDGHEALLVDGGGIDGGPGCFIACAKDDLHIVGTSGASIGCIRVLPDGTRVLAKAMPDPLAREDDDPE